MVHRSAHSRTKRDSRRERGSADVIPLPARKPGFENEETASVMDSPFGAEEMAPPPLPARPKLEVVPNKSSWPFAPDNAPLGMHAAEASTDRAIAETPVKKRSPIRLVPVTPDASEANAVKLRAKADTKSAEERAEAAENAAAFAAKEARKVALAEAGIIKLSKLSK